MASVLIDGIAPGAVVTHAYHGVFLKQNWADEWTWVPYMKCLRAVEQAAPGVGTASFDWDFGLIKQHFDADPLYYLPNIVQGWYVMTAVINRWGAWVAWIGVIQNEAANVEGSVFPSGRQGYDAYSIEHLLDRNYVNGAWTASGFIEREVRFNRTDGQGLSAQGNRSTAADAGEGVPENIYTFSSDGELWTNLDIIRYLLWNFVDDGITFELVGALDPLDEIVGEHNFFGRTVLDALNALVDRRYGLGWRLLIPSEPGGTVYVYIFSQLANPLQMGDVEVPANPVQEVLYTTGDHGVEAIFNFNSAHQFDSVEVLGAPIKMTGTFSYTDGTLESGWTTALRTAYEDPGHGDSELNDRARQAEKFNAVYQRHRIPLEWDGALADGVGGTPNNAHPTCNDDGTIDRETVSGFWMGDRRFDQELPFEESVAVDGQPKEFRRAFALIKIPDSDPVAYNYVERAAVDEELHTASLRVSDRDMAIWVTPRINHVYGLNVFTNEDTDVDPVFDFQTLLLTASFKTDVRLKVKGQVPGQLISETGRTKTIIVADAHYWLVMPGTVAEVVDGALVREWEQDGETHNFVGQYVVLRDDTDRLKQIAALSAEWFGMARGTATVRVKSITPAFPVSSLILGSEANWHATVIGTVVTQKTWDFEGDTTEIATGYDELAFADSVMKVKKQGLKVR